MCQNGSYSRRFGADNTMTGTQKTQNICIIFVQRRPNVFDVGSTLYKCYTNALCLLGSPYSG